MRASKFDALEAGARPLDLVRLHGITPALALKLVREHAELRQTGGAKDPLVARLDELEAELRALTATRNEDQARASDWCLRMEDHMSAMARRLAELPLPARRADFACGCGARGHYALAVSCTGCGHVHSYGFHPPANR